VKKWLAVVSADTSCQLLLSSNRNRKSEMVKKEEKGQPVLVTTEHRGVFFGYTKDPDAEVIELTNARLCLHWSADVKGFMGLAANGPSNSCRIGPAVPTIKLRKITAVLDVTTEAVKKWESEPWG
jgi:hypothetical protein